MANYTAADVKRLREMTGAGMMDCKKALEQNDGDFDKAVEFLRIKGAKDVGKRAERATAEGLVTGDGGVLIELDSETGLVRDSNAAVHNRDTPTRDNFVLFGLPRIVRIACIRKLRRCGGGMGHRHERNTEMRIGVHR